MKKEMITYTYKFHKGNKKIKHLKERLFGLLLILFSIAIMFVVSALGADERSDGTMALLPLGAGVMMLFGKHDD